MTGHDEPDGRVSWGLGWHAPAGETAVDAGAYFRYIGRWSALFAPAVVAAADVSPGECVLDIATGTGEAALAAIAAVGAAGRVVGTDVSLGMLTAARARLPVSVCPLVAADGQALPFREGSFDAVVCQLGLMFFTDPERGLREFRRVLGDGRRAAACVLSTAQGAPLWGILADALSAVLPAQRDVLQLSFRLADPTKLALLFSTAGFGDVSVRSMTREIALTSFDDYWATIESGTGQLPHAYRSLPDAARREVRADVHARLAPYRTSTGLVMPLEVLIATGRR